MNQAVTHSASENPLLLILPFLSLLFAIAFIPVLRQRWWHRAYPSIVAVLSGVTVIYQIGILNDPGSLLRSFHEYSSFIILLGSLYVVAAGIHIDLNGASTPGKNVLLLLSGALLANLIGTMGASILLIRPFLRYNRRDFHGYHIAFFIFIVSNMGGLLSPIGDPPLFLGFLEGVPSGWLIRNMFDLWFFAIGSTLVIFYLLDRRRSLRCSGSNLPQGDTAVRVSGLLNLIPLSAIIGSLFIVHPVFLREAIMIGSALVSLRFTDKKVHQQNEFNFLPLKELAILFIGIFITIGPVLSWLESHAGALHISTAGQLFWASGISSSILDNAPTYLAFFTLTRGLLADPALFHQMREAITSGAHVAGTVGAYSDTLRNAFNYLVTQAGSPDNLSEKSLQVANIVANHPLYLKAISAGSVFFGALTYIGNGPNFIIKTVAEHAGLQPPSFFRYIVFYSVPVLLPLFVIIWWCWLVP
jgi:Na+/H+ antiporter NhaD/arsenite permease-like protein